MVEQAHIGSSDIAVAPLNLGGNVFGWTSDRDASFEVLDAFVDGGGNFVDTADSYSAWVPGHVGGESEKILGEWIAARGNRDRVVIATKVAQHPEFKGLAAVNVHAAADASLKRLGVDTIDLYYAHFDDPDTPIEETAAAFSELVDAGKIRTIGLSNYSTERLNEWMSIAHDRGYHLPVAMQPLYSLVERGFEADGLQQAALDHGLSVFTYSSLARGFLAGKYRAAGDVNLPGASPRATGASQYLDARGQAVLAALDEVASAHSVEVASVALAWLRLQPAVTAPIASASRIAQLPALLASMTLDLSRDELEQLSSAGA